MTRKGMIAGMSMKTRQNFCARSLTRLKIVSAMMIGIAKGIVR